MNSFVSMGYHTIMIEWGGDPNASGFQILQILWRAITPPVDAWGCIVGSGAGNQKLWPPFSRALC